MKNRFLLIFLVLLLMNFTSAKGQDDATAPPKTTMGINVYLDAFYSFDFNRPDNKRVPFMVNHNRHNEFNLNLGTIALSVDNKKYRGNLIVQAGTYATDNYAAEDAVFRFINEASVGLSLSRNGKLWLDAGIIGSHIGWESLFQQSAITLTRSLMVENIPYYFAGAKLTYTFNKKWKAMAMINNGWQRIKRIEGNSMLSYGTMLQFNPGERIQLDWNTFIGTDDPDSTRHMRYFNEVYFLFAINDKWDLRTGVDFGLQQDKKGSSSYNPWFLAAILAQYSFVPEWALGMRVEYANDKYGVILANPSPNEFMLWGFSANLAFMPLKNVKAGIEGRYWTSPNNMFVRDEGFVDSDFFITLSLAINFGKDFGL